MFKVSFTSGPAYEVSPAKRVVNSLVRVVLLHTVCTLSHCVVNSLVRVALSHNVWLVVWACSSLSQCVVNSFGRVALSHSVRLVVWVV